MKKIILLIVLTFLFISDISSYATNFGYYKSDYEYGIFDSLKFNWKNREKGQKFIELRTETQEGRKYLEQETKSHEKNNLNENDRYRLMQENTVIY